MGRRPQISRAFLEEHRRRTFALGAAELADEFGVRAITVAMLCQVGHSARNTFYELFSSGADCFRFTAARGHELLFANAPDPAEEEITLAEVTRRLCEAAAAEPALVRFLLLHSRGLGLGEGDPSLTSAVGRLAALLAGARECGAADGLREEFVARVYLEMLTRRLLEDEGRISALPTELDPWALLLLAPAVPA